MNKTRLRLAALARSTLLRNSGILALASVAAQVLTLCATVVAARQVSVSAFGLLLSAMSIATLAVDFCDFGISVFLSRELAQKRFSTRDVLKVNFRRLPVALLVAPVWLIVCAVISDHLPPAVYVLGLYPAVLMFSLSANSASRGVGRFGVAAAGTLIERGILLASTGVGVILHVDVTLAYSLGLIVGGIFSSAFCFFKIMSERGTPPALSYSLLSLYVKSRHFGLGGLATDLSALEIPLVAATAGGDAAGQFGAANRVSGPLGVPAAAISGALFPRVARQSPRDGSRTTGRALLMLIPLGLIFLCLGVFAQTLVVNVLGKQYGSNTTLALRLVLVATWLGSLNQIVYAFFQGMGRQREVARSLVVTMCAGLLFTTTGSIYFGAPGAATGVVLKEVLTTGWVLVLWRRLLVHLSELEHSRAVRESALEEAK